MNPQQEQQFGARVASLGAVVFLAAACVGPMTWSWKGLSLLLFLCLYGEMRAVKLPGYGIFNPGEAFYTAGACLYGPAPGALMAVVVGLGNDLRRGKRRPVVIFNVGWALTTFSVVGLLYPKYGLLAAGLGYVATAGSLQAFGEHHFSHLPLSQTVKHQFKEMSILGPSAFLFAFLTMELFSLRSPVVFLLVLPMELAVSFVKTRELSRELRTAFRDLENAQAELVATGRKAALGVMSAGVAHEINNPLAAAVTNVHMLKTMNRDKNLKPALALLEKSVDRCQSIVSRMLKYSRQSSSEGVPCRIVQIVEDGVLFCGRKFGGDTTRLEVNVEHDSTVLADPTELVQIVSNLLSNAHDAGATVVTVEQKVDGNWILLSVTDDGQGIPPDVADKIFDPFFTTKDVGSGTGLGLSIAQGLARGFGGDLRLVKTQGGKTRFEVKLKPSHNTSDHHLE
jgi:signal transduction histidine kinase